MKFAKWIFYIAGIFGLISTIPLIFQEKMMGVKQPEFYYAFVFLDIGWQFIYLLIAKNPARYRLMMLPSIFAKGSAVSALTYLYLLGRVSIQWVFIGAVDGIFAILFLVSFILIKEDNSKNTNREIN